jgi:iron complex transport system substrate-binding protein
MKLSCLFVFICVNLLTSILPAFSGSPLADYPAVVVKDYTGSLLTLDRPVSRIACLYAFSGHAVAMLGRGQDMVAVVKGLKKDKLLHQIVPGVQQLPVVSSGGIIHIEALLATRPDLVFLKPETAKITAELKKLARFKLPYFVVGYNNMAQQMETIEMMGRAIGCHENALAYTRYYKAMIDRVRSRTKGIAEGKKVHLYHAINEPYRTDAKGTIEADWTETCGVINVSVEAGLMTGHGNKKFAGIEQILLWNPGVIIVNESFAGQLILGDKKWAPIRAVQDKKVFTIPVGISRWGHPGGLETPLAILWTAKTVYPELFQDIDMKQEVRAFYKQFFNIRLEDRMLDKILKGKGMRLDKQAS